jgi:hypothetical protein
MAAFPFYGGTGPMTHRDIGIATLSEVHLHPGLHERSADGVETDTELTSDGGQRLTLLVGISGGLESFALHQMGDGDSTYLEAFSQVVDRDAGLVGDEKLLDLSGPKAPLEPASSVWESGPFCRFGRLRAPRRGDFPGDLPVQRHQAGSRMSAREYHGVMCSCDSDN